MDSISFFSGPPLRKSGTRSMRHGDHACVAGHADIHIGSGNGRARHVALLKEQKRDAGTWDLLISNFNSSI